MEAGFRAPGSTLDTGYRARGGRGKGYNIVEWEEKRYYAKHRAQLKKVKGELDTNRKAARKKKRRSVSDSAGVSCAAPGDVRGALLAAPQGLRRRCPGCMLDSAAYRSWVGWGH